MADYGEPGFYQTRLRGRASGRVSPRDAVRAPRETQIFAAHGMIEPGQADPNQGQLFDTGKMPSRSHAEIVASHNVPPALPGGGHAGFMPGLERSNPARTRQAKVTAIKALDTSRQRTGVSRGGAPVKETIEDRLSVYARSSHAPWYAEAKPGGIGPGDAGEVIAHHAAREGVSHSRMVRAVAITSPRTGWTAGGAPGTTGYHMPNVDSAVNVVRDVKALPPGMPEDVVSEMGRGAYGKSLDTMKAKAGREFYRGEPKHPIPVADPASAKVPNFEQSLHLDHPAKHVMQQASRSYTVDVHDTTSMGADEQLLKSDTGYHVAAMTGRRAALKAGELPPVFQSRTWNVIRDRAQPESMGDARLFAAVPRGPHLGELHPNPAAIAHPEAAGEVQRVINRRAGARSSTAEKYGLEF